ncbi:hypothetical protein TrST_g3225 [Triparma strigata]|uniref:Uncharacterized protein n=2 Tax=Triparma TaxID=722752 RepID=A0A9W7AEE8_9STRA|nr:hypothetical protein TrST_g3225 [Triparma strigata]
MSKRTSEDLSSTIEILVPNEYATVDDEEKVSEVSKFDSDITPPLASQTESPSTGTTTASTLTTGSVSAGGDDFMHTDDFRQLFVNFVMVDTLVAMRWLDKKWHKVVERKLTEVEEGLYGEVIVHGGNEISYELGWSGQRRYRIHKVTKVVFHLNMTKVGDRACMLAINLVVVDFPEGVESIGYAAFSGCNRLKNIKFPKSLTSIGRESFFSCFSLESVDLLHTNVQELGTCAFSRCISLKEMKVPDSLQKFGNYVFKECFKLFREDINIYDNKAVVAYLRSIQ